MEQQKTQQQELLPYQNSELPSQNSHYGFARPVTPIYAIVNLFLFFALIIAIISLVITIIRQYKNPNFIQNFIKCTLANTLVNTVIIGVVLSFLFTVFSSILIIIPLVITIPFLTTNKINKKITKQSNSLFFDVATSLPSYSLIFYGFYRLLLSLVGISYSY